jgi:hypothetical protein
MCAQATTIDFESLSVDGWKQWHDPYTAIDVDGFRFASSGNATLAITTFPESGGGQGNVLHWQAFTFPLLITRQDGGSFSLLGFKAAELTDQCYTSSCDPWPQATVWVRGDIASGGVLNLYASVPTYLRDSPGGLWAALTFGPEWTSLSSVQVSGLNQFGGIDDIALEIVPVPTAVWLFGSALGVMGWTRRVVGSVRLPEGLGRIGLGAT